MITKEKINQTGLFFINKKSRVSQDEAHEILQYFRSIHQHPMTLFRHTIDRKLKKNKIDALVSQRLKRIPSIIKKLKIQKNMNLSRMQDIEGLRIVVEKISEVNLIRDEIKKVENHGSFKFTFTNEKNYIINPAISGYRSIHMVYKYEKNISIEKQCRIEIQHSWATAVEVMGTYLNQPLKQSFGEERYLTVFKKISALFTNYEDQNIDDYKLIAEVKEITKKVKLLEQLNNFNIATRYLQKNTQGKYLLLKMDFKKSEIQISHYSSKKFEQANKDYLNLELNNLKNTSVEVVLVSIQDIKKLEQSYPNYFMDTKDFINNLGTQFKLLELQEKINNLNVDNKEIKIQTDKSFEKIFINTKNLLNQEKK